MFWFTRMKLTPLAVCVEDYRGLVRYLSSLTRNSITYYKSVVLRRLNMQYVLGGVNTMCQSTSIRFALILPIPRK